MRILFLVVLMLICGTANAAMYSCADEYGTKILRSYPCEKNEKQQAIVKEVEPSHTIINSTGERQNYRSRSQEETNAVTYRDTGSANSNGYKELLDHCNAGIGSAMNIVNGGHKDSRTRNLEAMAPAMRAACGQNNGSLQGDKEKNDYCNTVTSMVMNIVNGGHRDNRTRNLAAMAPVMQAACEQNNNSAMNQPGIQASPSSSGLGKDVGQCMGACASEQGICSASCNDGSCIANCNGNGQCIGNCASRQGMCAGNCGAAHGRCVSRCN